MSVLAEHLGGGTGRGDPLLPVQPGVAPTPEALIEFVEQTG